MLLRLGLCLLFATLALTLTVHHGHHGKQSFLASSKKSGQPFMVQLNKKERSPQQKKEMISFLQKATNDIKSGSFIQKEMKKLDGKTTLQSVKLPLVNSMNTQYSGRVELGSNHQPFDIIFDTGSTAFFVNSLFCTDNDCATHRQFDPLSSKSLLATDPLMGLEVEYGSGIVDGVLVKEDVYIGNLKVPGYIMFLISQQSGVLASASFDGVAGLSFPEGESDGTQIISLFDAMKDQLPKPYFSLSLGRNDEPGSYLMFGGYDESHMASDLVWHDVIHSNYWMLDLTNIYVGDKPTEFCKNYKCGVVIDSGTSVLAAPTIVINEMQNLLGTMSCDALSTLPDVTFEIGKHKYPLTGAEYVVTMDKDQNTEFYEHSKDIVACSGLFSPMDIQAQDGTVIFILGDTFMSKYYSVFDNDARRIGLALQKR